MKRACLTAALLVLASVRLFAQDGSDLTAANQTPVQMACTVTGVTDSSGRTSYGLICKDNTGQWWTCGKNAYGRTVCTSELDPAPCPANGFLCGTQTVTYTVETVWVPSDIWLQSQYSGSTVRRPTGQRKPVDKGVHSRISGRSSPSGGSRVQLRNQTDSPAYDPFCTEYAADNTGVYYDCDDYGGQVCEVYNNGTWSCQVRCTCYSYNSQGVCSSYGPPGCAT